MRHMRRFANKLMSKHYTNLIVTFPHYCRCEIEEYVWGGSRGSGRKVWAQMNVTVMTPTTTSASSPQSTTTVTTTTSTAAPTVSGCGSPNFAEDNHCDDENIGHNDDNHWQKSKKTKVNPRKYFSKMVGTFLFDFANFKSRIPL